MLNAQRRGQASISAKVLTVISAGASGQDAGAPVVQSGVGLTGVLMD